jgi:hypothetical protein
MEVEAKMKRRKEKKKKKKSGGRRSENNLLPMVFPTTQTGGEKNKRFE